MELSKAQISALVLGYLKNEELGSVVEEFLKSCDHFRGTSKGIRNGRYITTRVADLRLVDFLEEYALIYTIVQGRLEETDFYELYNSKSVRLVERILFLLDRKPPECNNVSRLDASTSTTSEVEATPAHTLPGNVSHEDTTTPKIPKRKSSFSKSRDKDEVAYDVSGLITSFMDFELPTKIAETINNVRNTPEAAKNIEENISAGASKEIDDVIKEALQKTQEDPVYNKFLEEIYVTENDEVVSSSPKKTTSEEREETSPSKIDEENNDAIRSIIEAVQIPQDPPPAPPPPPPPPPEEESDPTTKTNNNGEVILFDGTLDTYLKSSGATTTPIIPTSICMNTGSLIVMPPTNSPPKSFYIVNNQPILNVKTPVLTEKELMSIPTIIVNDSPATSQTVTRSSRRNRLIRAKPSVTTPTTQSTNVLTTRQASHVRNLDFSTPAPTKKTKKAWDEDLRMLIGKKDKTPSPKKKKPAKKKKPPTTKTKKKEAEEKEIAASQTPVKDIIPKTPGGGLLTGNTSLIGSLNEVLEEHLEGVDLNTIPTPSVPITPGFGLTPYNQRSTDYSTSSSYYQPSDNEQNKSIEQLIEECKRIETIENKDKFTNLKILSDVVIEHAKVPVPEQKNEHLKKFNNNIIGKKNLSLIKRFPTTSSSSEESDSEVSKSSTNKTVICKKDTEKEKTDAINNIINTIEVKKTLDEKEIKIKGILTHLEAVRQRTVQKMKNDEVPPTKKQPPRKGRTKAPPVKRITRKNSKKKEDTDQKRQELVEGLAERGIHLVPKKKELTPPPPPQEEPPPFQTKTYQDFETLIHDSKNHKRELTSYNFDVLKKSMSVKVFNEESNEEVTSILKWTAFDAFLELKSFSPKKNKKTEQEIEDELMDFVFFPNSQDAPKTGKKRKSRHSEDDGKQVDKKTKVIENNLKLLKKIDVDTFLDKVHGE